MHLILLPGNSRHNKEWIEGVESKLIDLFDSSHIHYYKHWKGDPTKEMDFHSELKRLQKSLGDYDDYIIFAKSAGAILTLLGIKEGALNPSKCILVGTAVDWAKIRGLDVEWLMEGFTVPTLFIHKTHDPVISHKRLKNLAETLLVKNYEMVELPGDDHHYDDTDTLKSAISEYLRESVLVQK